MKLGDYIRRLSIRAGQNVRSGSSFRNLYGAGRAVLLVSLVLLACMFMYPRLRPPAVGFPGTFETANDESLTQPQPVATQPLQQSGGRQVFGTAALEVQASAPAPLPEQGTGEAFKNLKLVAVLLGETPQAVLEDQKTRQVYTLAKGEYIGTARLIEVGDGVAVFSYADQTIELRL